MATLCRRREELRTPRKAASALQASLSKKSVHLALSPRQGLLTAGGDSLSYSRPIFKPSRVCQPCVPGFLGSLVPATPPFPQNSLTGEATLRWNISTFPLEHSKEEQEQASSSHAGFQINSQSPGGSGLCQYPRKISYMETDTSLPVASE